jgi:hypothetical protein
LSLSTSIGIPLEISRERWAAATTRSNLFGIFLIQSSTVTRAINKLHFKGCSKELIKKNQFII